MSATPLNDWLFDQPRNCATITLRRIIDGSAPIPPVTHDEEDHGWQSLDGGAPSQDDAAVVALEEIVDLDRTVLRIADLPAGWIASRRSVGSSWTRERNPRTP